MKTVIISGGSDGLGKSIAQELKDTHQVVILSPTEEKLKHAASELGVDYEVCDVSSFESCEKTIINILKKYDTLDVLINNAGLWIQGELEQNESDKIKRVIEVNALGVVNLTKAVIPQMKKQKDGIICNINSQAGLYAKGERTVYNLTKWGITGFTKSLQPELAKYGIRVSDIHPGKMKTEMFSKMGIDKDMSDGVDTKYVAQVIKFIISLPSDVCVPEIGIKHTLG